MKRCKNASTLCVAMLSLEIIVINLLVFIPSLKLDENIVTIVTVCLSAFVLVLSLLISQLKYDRKEEEYHRCGIQMGALEKRIDIFISSEQEVNYDVVSKYEDEYQKILRDSNLNHLEIDRDQALRNTDEYKKSSNFGERAWLYIRWHLLMSDSIYNMITALGIAAIIAVAIWGKKENIETSSQASELSVYALVSKTLIPWS